MRTEKPFTRALSAPAGNVTTLNSEMMKPVIEGSRQSPRKRIILPLHKTADSPLHRMLNGLRPYSYIQPHRHLHRPKAESVIVLQRGHRVKGVSKQQDIWTIFTIWEIGTDELPGETSTGEHKSLVLVAS